VHCRARTLQRKSTEGEAEQDLSDTPEQRLLNEHGQDLNAAISAAWKALPEAARAQYKQRAQAHKLAGHVCAEGAEGAGAGVAMTASALLGPGAWPATADGAAAATAGAAPQESAGAADATLQLVPAAGAPEWGAQAALRAARLSGAPAVTLGNCTDAADVGMATEVGMDTKLVSAQRPAVPEQALGISSLELVPRAGAHMRARDAVVGGQGDPVAGSCELAPQPQQVPDASPNDPLADSAGAAAHACKDA
jgi:hypothetical protein